MDLIQKIREIIDEIERRIHFLWTDILLSSLEVEIYEHMDEYTQQFDGWVNNELQQLKNVREGTGIKEFEDQLGDLQVFLGTELREHLERMENNNDKLQRAIQNYGEVEQYHHKFAENTTEAINTEVEEAQRLENAVQSVIERLDRNADPQEMARLLDNVGENRTQDVLRDAKHNVRQMGNIVEENNLEKYRRIKDFLRL